MHVVISKFVIANDMVDDVRNAFLKRPHLVDTAKGFIRMEVMSPSDKREEIWLMTYWLDQESYQIWHASHAYHDSHAGIPKGLKLVPRSTEIRNFEVFAS